MNLTTLRGPASPPAASNFSFDFTVRAILENNNEMTKQYTIDMSWSKVSAGFGNTRTSRNENRELSLQGCQLWLSIDVLEALTYHKGV